ncbi:helix-turn-helix domain-containing GNAT family N-acetyltransferase [Streptomyces sp. DSM 40750]|uniref:helix-turn-helix domain-containing GNAT family N-acetyltransferase n=1 Tax=Streptomyces sp. DSM 40750 TaxID=2801030 RepID=UPI00214AE959|nr:helix-turn-helix domain-containing GNAT family N-acetyltransferase [Streptomyces sp. DSM 40750]UUU24494.1 helix-turn-helix domain-containing GNAT family N-acetyltransferase [Streptomyces sp. DSM 40750]
MEAKQQSEPVAVRDVRSLRRFNRYFTRRIGALDDHYLGQGRPLGEARLLFEIGEVGAGGEGASLRELRARLGLDAGYLSRMVKALEGQGLVRVGVHGGDNRMRVAELTPAGRSEVDEQNRRADALAEGLLRGLSPAQRGELTDALGSARRLLRLAAIRVEVVDGGSDDARACLDAYAADIDERFPEGYDPATLVPPHEVSGASGAFLVAYEEDRAVACGALRTLDPRGRVGEIKHVWVHPGARRLGLARRLLGELEREAAERGFGVVRLDTHASLTEAQAMYRACGYTEIPRYNDDVYGAHFFEKRLATPRRR